MKIIIEIENVPNSISHISVRTADGAPEDDMQVLLHRFMCRAVQVFVSEMSNNHYVHVEMPQKDEA